MEITYLGHSSFKIKGKKTVAVTDPFSPEMMGIKFPETLADIVTVSHQHKDHNYLPGITGNPLVISGPGEYEVKGVKIIGLGTYHDAVKGGERGKNTVYRFEMDGISLVHLGDLGHKLEDKDLEVLDGIDILMIPVGGFYTINAHEAVEVISQLEPKIIIPMRYKAAKLDQTVVGKLDEVTVFLKEMGKENILPVPKLSITKDKLPAEPIIVVLEY